MRYELYGVMNESGANTFIGAYRSVKAALEASKTEINTVVHPAFIVLEKARKHSAPFGSLSGYAGTGIALRATAYVTGANPVTNPTDGQNHWKSFPFKR